MTATIHFEEVKAASVHFAFRLFRQRNSKFSSVISKHFFVIFFAILSNYGIVQERLFQGGRLITINSFEALHLPLIPKLCIEDLC